MSTDFWPLRDKILEGRGSGVTLVFLSASLHPLLLSALLKKAEFPLWLQLPPDKPTMVPVSIKST